LGHPLFRTFTARDYGSIGQTQVVIQDNQGRMFFGCRDAIAMFDNSRWETIPVPEAGFIASLAVDPKGTIWFSSSALIGYLAETDSGLRLVRVADGTFGIFSKIVARDDGIYLATQDGLLLWKDGHLSQRPWPSGSIWPLTLTLFHGKLAVGDGNGSIYELGGDRFEQIRSFPSVETGEVRAIVDCPIQDGLVVTLSGIFRKVGSNLVPWKTDIDSLLHRHEAISANWIQNKYLAVVLVNSGVYLLDGEGRLVENLTLENGLEDAGFRASTEDRDGGLWICSDTDITRIQCDTSCTEFDHQLGLPRGMINGVIRYQGKVYTSTGHGIYVLKSADGSGESAHFVPFGDRDERFYGVMVDSSRAYACANSGTYTLDVLTSTLTRIGSGSVTIAPSRVDPGRVFIDTWHGLELVHNVNGQWSSEGMLPEFRSEISQVGEDEKGDVFVAAEDGFYRIQLKRNAAPPFAGAKIEPLLDEQNHQVGAGRHSFCSWNGKMLFETGGRLWDLRPGTNRVEPFNAPSGSSLPAEIQEVYWTDLPDGHIWVRSLDDGRALGRFQTSGRYEPLSRLITYPLGTLYDVWEDDTPAQSVAWIAGDYGLMRVDLNQPTFTHRKFELYATAVVNADGKSIPVQQGRTLTLNYDNL
jgi:ligand-binding sensor domain-containing protein